MSTGQLLPKTEGETIIRSRRDPKSVNKFRSLFINHLEDLPHNASKWPLVVMSTKGRLANGLFQYALGLVARKLFPDALVGVSEKVDAFARKVLEPDCLVLPVISKTFCEENSYMFDHNEPDYRKGDMTSFFLPRIENGVRSFKENNTMITIGMEAFDYKLLHIHRDLIRKKMKILKHNLEEADHYINEILVRRFGEVNPDRKKEVVGFHIRRKDYILFSSVFHKHGLPDKGYYERALKFYRRKLFRPTFIICTDDEEHAFQALKGLEKDSDIVIKGKGSEGEDIALLASFQYFILTVGTFGFIPAFLANKDVVYPLFLYKKPSRFANDTSIPTWKVINYEEEGFEHYYGLHA